VLQLITAEYLFKLRPEAREGEMTQLRSAMVNTNTLAALAEELGLGDHLFLGKGIARGGGRTLRSLLANAFEAVLGAVFLDAGYDAAYHYYLDRFRAMPEPVQDENYKGRLQQVVQERFSMTPYYDSAGARGGRQREYTAVVYAGADPLGTGHGSTKQAAEQEAARSALDELDRRVNGRKSRSRRRRPAAEPAVEAIGRQEAETEVEAGVLEKAVALASGQHPPSEPVADSPPSEPAPKPRRRARRSRKTNGEAPATAAAAGTSEPPEVREPAPAPPPRESTESSPPLGWG
jgi:dsRNA-specific ribonuclease